MPPNPISRISSIAIIGAGPSGLAAAKYLIAEKRFSKIDIYEQRSTVGGVWNHTPLNHAQTGLSLPRTRPTSQPEQRITPSAAAAAAGEAQFMSPLYDLLETNIPYNLMNYTDLDFPADCSLFPPHNVVLDYLTQYGKELRPHITFNTQVEDVAKTDGDKPGWHVAYKDLETGQNSKDVYDAVVVASGHYSDPFVPDISRIAEFEAAHPGTIIHSKYYRRPDQYTNKKVIVVGNSASGIDISMQLATVALNPILISEKETYTPPSQDGAKTWARHVPEITEFIPESRSVRFADGSEEPDIDAVIFCTGFHYSFPFLQSLNPSVVVADGSHASHLWQHMLYTADPTLAFLAIPQRIVPFPIAEAQSAVIARMWAGRLQVPDEKEMEAWVRNLTESAGEGKARHVLAFPLDLNYINLMYGLSMEAARREGLENDGMGKRPPYWNNEKAWIRQRIPYIKVASRALGSRRHEVKTLKQLGFDYAAWAAENGAGVGE